MYQTTKMVNMIQFHLVIHKLILAHHLIIRSMMIHVSLCAAMLQWLKPNALRLTMKPQWSTKFALGPLRSRRSESFFEILPDQIHPHHPLSARLRFQSLSSASPCSSTVQPDKYSTKHSAPLVSLSWYRSTSSKRSSLNKRSPPRDARFEIYIDMEQQPYSVKGRRFQEHHVHVLCWSSREHSVR